MDFRLLEENLIRLPATHPVPSTRGTATLIAEEWLSDVGGAAKVFRHLQKCFPAADAVCLWSEAAPNGHRVVESRLANSWLRDRKNLALPAMPLAWKSVQIDQYDTVIALSHAFAHHLSARAARTGRRAFTYVHTPARYLWVPDIDPRGRRALARMGAAPLRVIDRRGVERRVNYAANSQYIRRRIQKCWGVDATVIHPPVDAELITSVPDWRNELDPAEVDVFRTLPPGGFVLGASRLVTYKRIDRAIDVGEALDMPVVIAGSGPAQEELKDRAERSTVPVVFTGRVSDEMLYALYQAAMLFVFLGIEDFGLMPVEAIAAGTPVLINTEGGARESVLALDGGAELHHDGSRADIVEAAEHALSRDMTAARDRLDQFSSSTFHRKVLEWTGTV